MQNYPPSKKDHQPLQPRRGLDRRWTTSSPEPKPPDDQGAGPAPLIIGAFELEIPVTVRGLVSRGPSPRLRAKGPPVNPRPGASPVRPATGNVKKKPGHSWTSALRLGLLRTGQRLLSEAPHSSPLSCSPTGTLLRAAGPPRPVTVRAILRQEARMLSSETSLLPGTRLRAPRHGTLPTAPWSSDQQSLPRHL